jgi:hypothetical protein
MLDPTLLLPSLDFSLILISVQYLFLSSCSRMAQRYSVPGQYPQEMYYSAPPPGHWQDYPPSMSPPPYPGNCPVYLAAPSEPRTAYHTKPSEQQTLHEGSQLPSFSSHQAILHDVHHKGPGLPIVIPQISPGAGNPFTRAYSSSLANANISLTTFLTFLDNLNICLAQTPQLQVLDLAGGMVGMVPHHIPALIGGSLQATAKIANAVTSKTRVASLMKTANAEIFGPQGHDVEVVTTEKLKQKLGIDETKPLLCDLDGKDMEMSVRNRQLQALEPYVAPLIFDIPVPTRQTNVLDRLAAGQLKRHMAKAEEKAIEARKKENKKADKKAKKEDKKAEKDRRRGKDEKKRKAKDDKEIKAAEKLLWLYVGRI